MPTSKSVKRKSSQPVKNVRRKKLAPVESMPVVPEAQSAPETSVPKSTILKNYLPAGVLAIAVILVLLVKNGFPVAAVVNGQPIFSWQLSGRLMSRFGDQTLEGMVTEKLITSASRQAGVTVSDDDVTARQNEMLQSIGQSVSLDELLKYQGITKEDFQSQLKLQLSVEKILGKEIEVTESEIDQYIASYSARMAATEAAGLREEAKKAIFDQEISQKVNTWYADLKAKARILKLR